MTLQTKAAQQQLTTTTGAGQRFVEGPGQRVLIRQEGRPDRVALPSHAIAAAVSKADISAFMRFYEASEMSKGNMAVAILGGEPRGRFKQFSSRMSVQTYAKYEIDAYRWILGKDSGRQFATIAEVFARLEGERMEGNLLDWGIELGGAVVNNDQAIGAVMGASRVLCPVLADAYRRYADHWTALQKAASHNRALTADDSDAAQRRGSVVRAGL